MNKDAIPEEPGKDRKILHRVMIGTASNYLGQIVAFAALFFLTPFILHKLGPVEYGLWVLIGSVTAYGSIFDFGIWGALIKYVAEYRARGEHEKAHRLTATALRLYALLGLAVTLLGLGFAPIFPLFFKYSAREPGYVISLFRLMSLGVGISLPAMAPMAVLRGLQRYDLVNLVDITSMILTTAASVIILIMGKGIIGLILVNITGMLFVMLFSGLLVRKVAPELHFGWRGADRKFIRSVLGYSWPLFVKDVSYRLQTKTDEITVGAFLPLQAIAPYNLARKLSESIYTLTKQFMKVLLPLASELHAENDRVRLRSVFVTGTRLALAISIGIGSILIALRQPVLLLWVGKGYENAGPLIVILTIATFVSTSLWPAGAVLQGMARHRVLALTSFCNGLANLGISLALIKPLGLMGVALGTLIPNVLEFFVLMPFAMRVIGVSWGRALQDIFLPSIGPVVPMALTFYVLLRMLEPANLFVTIFVAACGFCVFMMSYLSLGITQIERKTAQGIAFSVFQIARTQIRRSE